MDYIYRDLYTKFISFYAYKSLCKNSSHYLPARAPPLIFFFLLSLPLPSPLNEKDPGSSESTEYVYPHEWSEPNNTTGVRSAFRIKRIMEKLLLLEQCEGKWESNKGSMLSNVKVRRGGLASVVSDHGKASSWKWICRHLLMHVRCCP